MAKLQVVCSLIITVCLLLCGADRNVSLKYSAKLSTVNGLNDLYHIDRSQDILNVNDFGGVDLTLEARSLQRTFQTLMVDELGIRIMQVRRND